ncbi:MAG: tetratricopeptide repeat protein [Desulfuromonas sp.]|nr:tetratricopeptide repeat protein [Desulfuromonas sp.]
MQTVVTLLLSLVLASCSGVGNQQLSTQPSQSHRVYADYLRARMFVADGDIAAALEALASARAADPDAVYLRTSQASLYIEQGEFDQAYQLLSGALQQQPDNVDTQLLIADLLYNRNLNDDRLRAMMMFHSILQQNPHLDELYLHLSQLHLMEQDYPQALAVIQLLLVRQPQNVTALLQQAKLYILLDEDNHAQEVYRQIIAIEPQGRQAYVYLGNLLEQDNQLDAALVLYQQAAQQSEDRTYFDHLRATLLTKHQRYADALRVLKQLLERDPLDYSAVSKMGLVHLKQQQWQLAEQVLLRAVAMKPLSQEYYWLGYALEQQEKWSAAAGAYQLVVKPRYLHDEATERLAFVYAQKGDFIKAANTIEQLLSQEPSAEQQTLETETTLRPAVYLQLALYYEYAQRMQQVEDALTRGLARYPESADLYYAAGVYYAQQGKLALMEQHMRRCIEFKPDHGGALNYLAYTYAEKDEKLDEALELAQRAVGINANGAYLDTLGWVYYKRGNFAQARIQLERALKIMPQDMLVQEHMADIYVALGLYDSARKIYTELLHNKPDNQRLQQKIGDLPK